MVCCVTGHRPKGFPFSRNIDSTIYNEYLTKLETEVKRFITDGYTHFITGMADGADIDFANSVIKFIDSGFSISLEAAIPYPIHTSHNVTEYSCERNRILKRCSKVTVASPYYHKGCMQIRNEYMVDNSDIVLAIWSGNETGETWNTIRYARSKGKEIKYIMLNE